MIHFPITTTTTIHDSISITCWSSNPMVAAMRTPLANFTIAFRHLPIVKYGSDRCTLVGDASCIVTFWHTKTMEPCRGSISRVLPRKLHWVFPINRPRMQMDGKTLAQAVPPQQPLPPQRQHPLPQLQLQLLLPLALPAPPAPQPHCAST